MSADEKTIATPAIKSLPLISLVRKTGDREGEPPTTRLLERAPSWMDRKPRLFMVAKAVSLPEEEIINIMRLSRHETSLYNYQHDAILSRARWDIQDAGYKFLENGGGGFISDDPDNRTISVVCKSVMGPADPKEVIEILRKGLPKEYDGYTIETEVIERI